MRISSIKNLLLTFAISMVLVFTSVPSWAVPFGFTNITDNGPVAASVATQLGVDVTESSGQVLFVFSNVGAITAVMAQVYFDYGDSTSILSFAGFDAATTTADVNFNLGASPGDLPGGEYISFSADTAVGAVNPAPANGIGLDESLGILFDYGVDIYFSDIIALMTEGDMRIGTHVISIGEYSEGFVTGPPPEVPVPEPSTLLLLGAGITGLAFYRRKKK